MNENEDYFSFEDRVYLNPTQSRDEQLSFIDTLRETQANNTTQINADTYALGSQLPSSLGGLRGGEETFAARYQRPQTEATIADLRTAAQQSALNQALTNLQSAWKKRYNDAILNYQRRAATPSTTPSNDPYKGNVNVETPTEYPTSNSISGGLGKTMSVLNPDGSTSVYRMNADGSQGPLLGVIKDGQFTAQENQAISSSIVSGALGALQNAAQTTNRFPTGTSWMFEEATLDGGGLQ